MPTLSLLLPGGIFGADDVIKRYRDYLNAGVDYGYMTGTVHGYYQSHDYYDMSASSNPLVRELYDDTYKFIKGTYTKK